MSVPPPNSEDQSLLRAWAECADETAFRALVQRHLGMVQATALRRLEREPLAQDVCQTVFALLARRAGKLASHPCLAGWLHRTATLEAANVLRRELKHRRLMNTLARENPEAGSDPLAGVVPHLDAAIESMSESDRYALFLRFTERLSFDAMGARLGKSADACQKQTSRALERLSLILRRRGCIHSAAALGATVTAGTAKTAPAALASSMSGTALKASPHLPFLTLVQHSLYAMNTAKQTAAAAALVAALASLPLASQWSEAASLRGELATAPAATRPPAMAERTARSGFPASPESKKRTHPSMSVAEADDFLALLAGLDARPRPSQELTEILVRVMSLPGTHMRPALERISGLKNVVYQMSLHVALFARWGEIDPPAALAACPRSSMLRSISTLAAAQGWMETDPRGLLESLKSKNNQLQKIDEGLVSSISKLDPALAEEFLSLYPSHTSAKRRVEYLLATDPEHFEENVAAMIKGESFSPNVALEAKETVARLLASTDPQRAMAFAEENLGEKGLGSALHNWVDRNPQEAMAWLEKQPAERQNRFFYNVQDAIRGMTEAERSKFVGAGPPDTHAQRLMVTAHVIAKTQPQEAISLAQQAPPEVRPRTFHVIAYSWSEKEPEAASEWVDSLPQGPDRDHAIDGLTLNLASNDPQSAMMWAASIGDATLREDVLRKRIAIWLHDNRPSAEAWMKSSDVFTPEQRDALLAAKNLPLER